MAHDPHDRVTRELPLEPLPVDERVAALVAGQAGDLRLYAEAAFDLGYHYLSWLYLMEREVRG